MNAIDKIKCVRLPYRRITIHILQKYIGYYNLHQYKHRLPKCFNIINLECESIADYQKRRIEFVLKDMASKSKNITFAKVFNSAGLRNTVNPDVLDYIYCRIKDYKQGKIL